MLLGVVILIGVARAEAAPESTSRPAADLAREYDRRLAKLADDDVKGHYALAEWCHRQEQYGLLLSQAENVLELDPKHANAKLLRTIAIRHLKERGAPQDNGADPNVPRPRPGQAPPDEGLITKEDVQKLRYAELREVPTGDRRVPPDQREFVQVRFGKGVLTEFLDAMSNHEDFMGKANRKRFLRFSPTDQLLLIRHHQPKAYADRIEILSDPLVLRKFKRVMPILQAGCGTANCHGGENPAKPFGLRPSYLHPDLSLGTNFLILDRVTVRKDRLVNRAKPKASLILEHGLPEQFAEKSHPTEIKPLFPRGPRDPRYRLVLDWIEALRMPRPRTGIKVKGHPEPPPPGAAILRGAVEKPADTPKKKEGNKE